MIEDEAKGRIPPAIRAPQNITTQQLIRSVAVTVALMGGLVLNTGCQQAYDPPSLINKLRIVGVKAEPPVLTGTPSTLTPLVIGAKKDVKLCHAWSLCLFALGQNGNFECVDRDLEQALGTAPTAQVSLGDALPLATKLASVFEKLEIAIPPQFQGRDAGTPGLSDASGFEVFVRFKVAEADGADVVGGACPTDALTWLEKPCVDRASCLAGYKKIALALDPKDVHKNPVITGLELDGVAWPEDVTPTVPCYGGDDFYGKPGPSAVAMKPLWDKSSLEVIGPSPDPKATAPLREGILFSWLSTDGDWDKQRSFDELPENSFFPPDYGGVVSRFVRIWIVARDGRNGTTWITRQVEVKRVVQTTVNPLCLAKPSLKGCP